MKNFVSLLMVTLFVSALAVEIAEAHSGRTAQDGCHNDRKRGTRHCH